MKGRWIPFLATTAALALASVAPAQDRGRRGGGGGGGNERSSPPPPKERTSPPPTRSDPPQRSTPPPTRIDPPQRSTPPPTRSDPPQRSSPPPTRTDPTPRDRRSDPPSSPPRSDPGERSRRSDPPASPPVNTGGSGGDSRPNRGGGNDESRRNPFERTRSGDKRHDVPVNRDDRPSGGGVRGDGERPVRERPSRSGKVDYGTRSNGYGNARPTRFGGGLNRASLSDQIRRTDIRTGYNVSYGGVFGGLRVGYVGYNTYWNDDYFCYPYYVFNPWASNGYCVASPWYRYSYLPGYINTSRVIVVNNYVSPWAYNDWQDYRYDSRERDRRDEAIDNTLDDIRDAFERNNTRYADRVVPQTGQVAIFNDGKYDYSLGAEDFQDMFLDGVEQSKTTRYDIIESKVRGDEVRLRARHEYEDSWGEKQVVFHSYTLRRENGRYVIREFGTD